MLGDILLVFLGLILVTFMAVWLYGERWRPLRLSTWRVMKEAGLKRNLNLSALHGYVYGRWIKEYINILLNHIMPRIGPKGKQWWANHYHGKVITTEDAKSIITLNKDIPLKDLEQIIPYSTARDLVLKGPPDVAVFECGCRGNSSNPCEPTQVCMVIGQPFVDFVLDHHPKTSRKLTQQEALDLLEAERDRGHFHSAWFKDAMLDRFYAICNCCKCCCGGVITMTKFNAPMVVSSGYITEVDENLCTSCFSCVDACPFNAIQNNGKPALDWEACLGCGVCVTQCENDARSLVRDEKKGIPFDINIIAEEARAN